MISEIRIKQIGGKYIPQQRRKVLPFIWLWTSCGIEYDEIIHAKLFVISHADNYENINLVR